MDESSNSTTCDNMSSTLTSNTQLGPGSGMCQTYYLWRISAFDKIQMLPGDEIHSPKFDCCDGRLKWSLAMCPFGPINDTPVFISTYLDFHGNQDSRHDGVTAYFNICLKNTNGDIIRHQEFESEDRGDFPGQGLEILRETVLKDIERNGTLLVEVHLKHECGSCSSRRGKMFTLGDKHRRSDKSDERLLLFMQADKFADITLLSNSNDKFKCHGVILASHSPVMESYLSHDSLEKMSKEIVCPFTSDQLKILLEYMYKRKIRISESELKSIIEVADYYGIDDLKQSCETALSSLIQENNILEIARLARDANAQSVYNTCVENVKSYMCSGRWLSVITDSSSREMMRCHPEFFVEFHQKLVSSVDLCSGNSGTNAQQMKPASYKH